MPCKYDTYRAQSHHVWRRPWETLQAGCLQKLAGCARLGGMATLKVGGLGEFLREQRRSAQLSLRQLADAAGVSNPYLSQIERGLRKPSAEILQQLARALRISAESLYVQAGILDERPDAQDLAAAIWDEPTLTEPQKRALVQVLRSFQSENSAASPSGPSAHARPVN